MSQGNFHHSRGRGLEEEVIPAIQRCLARVDELDERLLAQQELLQRWQPMA